MAGSVQGGQDQAAAVGYLIPMRFRDLAEDSVCPQKPQLAADVSRATALLGCVFGWLAEQACDYVSIPQPIDRELRPGHYLEQRGVVAGQRVQPAQLAAALARLL